MHVRRPVPTAVLLLLHLAPGTAVLIAYLAFHAALTATDFPPTFALNLAFLIIGLPLQGVILVWLARREGASVRGLLRWLPRRPWWPLVLVLAFIPFGALVWSLLQPTADALAAGPLAWLPQWFLEPSSAPGASSTVLWIFLATNLLINGLLSPVVEELYFRSALLPRLGALGAWAPLVNAFLFTIAHWWQPQAFLQLLVLVVPLYYVVWWRHDVRISILTHSLANAIGGILLIGETL